MTNQERIDTELLHAQKMEALGQLIGGIAHEINNPLAAISAFGQLLVNDERLPPDLAVDANLLVQEAERTRRIVQGLLDFARPTTPERKPTDVAGVIDRTMALSTYALRAGHIEVVTQLPDDLPPVLANPDELQQVLLNLVLNAIQAITAAHANGRLSISAQSVPRELHAAPVVRVRVEDNGPGVAEEIRGRLFEPFFTTRGEGEGTGLGLSVSKQIIDSHGGRLWFEPVASGGAAFLFDIPAVSE